MLGRLADPRLTGMSAAQLQQLAAELAPAQAARAQQRYSQQRGGRARRATGNPRARPLFGDAARLLLTLLYQRQVCSMNVAGGSPGSHRHLHRRPRQGDPRGPRRPRPRHREWPRSGSPPPMPCSTSWTAICAPHEPQIIERLSHPALTGLTQHRTARTHQRLVRRQSAQAERLVLSAARRPTPARHPGRRLPPEDQQQRTRPAHHPLPQRTVHPGRPRRRPRRRQQVRRRQRHPRNLATPPARRPHSRPRADPLPHSGRSPRRRSNERHADKLILYGFSGSGTAATRRRAGRRRWRSPARRGRRW